MRLPHIGLKKEARGSGVAGGERGPIGLGDFGVLIAKGGEGRVETVGSREILKEFVAQVLVFKPVLGEELFPGLLIADGARAVQREEVSREGEVVGKALVRIEIDLKRKLQAGRGSGVEV